MHCDLELQEILTILVNSDCRFTVAKIYTTDNHFELEAKDRSEFLELLARCVRSVNFVKDRLFSTRPFEPITQTWPHNTCATSDINYLQK